MVFSASINIYNKAPFYFITRQSVFIILALSIAFVTLKTPIGILRKLSPIFFVITLILLTLVFVPVIGGEVKGAYRWIHLGFFNLQPSEIMKLVIILFMAGFLCRQEKDIQNSGLGLYKTIAILMVVGLLLLLETDIGSFLIISITTMMMLFIAGARLGPFVLLSLLLAITAILVVFLLPERMARITAFLDPWADPYGKSYQLIQSLISIGLGEWFGVGLGQGIQKGSFLPDAHTDFIFSVIGEELGVIGMLSVLFLFTYIVIKSFIISNISAQQGKLYSSFVAFGIGIWLTLQVLINLGVNIGLLPTKGLTLPLFSYGGSSMIIVVISLAILLRIDIENKSEYRL
ncbi:Cell division protein FtsW [hydrothermal vent metagenome]|uniref:peptidoglycan glycosyltransferase n=1 Tax=hydrothermal vent metagenome TaxID=652676 RepID=A0A1W1CQC5_9ZZZZ